MIGWMTDLDDANEYFYEKRLETTKWDALSSADKEKAMWNAYNRINNSPRFSIPAVPTAAQLVKLEYAQCEMSYYLAVHLFGEDVRKGLQAQGVVEAGIVKEKYDKDMLNKLPFPPAVEELLEEFFEFGDAMVMIPIDRDENEDMDTDVVEED